MSYDPENFLGLRPGGDDYAPPGSQPSYTIQVTSSDPDGAYGGVDFYECWNADLSVVALCRAPASSGDVDRDADTATAGGGAYAITDVPSADYYTVYVACREGIFGLEEVVGYYTGCNASGLFGPECTGEVTPDYQLVPSNVGGADPGTFDPITSPYTANGADKGLEGWLKPPSTVYAGDPSNTASDLLWNAGDIATLRLSIEALGSGFHSAHLPVPDGLRWFIRPFWKPRHSMVMFV